MPEDMVRKHLRDIESRRRDDTVGEAAHYLGYLQSGRLWEDEVAEFDDKFRIRADVLKRKYADDADAQYVLSVQAPEGGWSGKPTRRSDIDWEGPDREDDYSELRGTVRVGHRDLSRGQFG